MIPRARHLRLIAVMMAATALHACNTPFNVLASIDGPYVSPNERAALAHREAQAPLTTAQPAASALPTAADAPPGDPARTADDALVTAPLANPHQDQLDRAVAAAGYTVVSTMPAPSPADGPATDRSGAGASAGPVLRDFFAFATARLDALPSGGERQSMLLADPSSLDPELQRCGNLPPAVLIDLDPASGLLPLVSDDRPSPELAGYLDRLRQRGVTIYWISGHGPGQASAIRRRLVAAGLDRDGSDPLIVTRFAGESKQARRYALGQTNCLLAIMGDQRADFDELYDFVLDPIMAAPLEELLGHGWFLAPPPLD